MNFYNDNDPFCCAWLRELIKANLIAPGVVDERSICDIRGEELRQFTQCHFFAGIGGWSLALRLAGWPDNEPVWTGSCPCQPLSCAGQRKGHADSRHLWPAFHALIDQCRPATVFGEQVASADGREWLAGVRADLEGMGYAVGAADLCAAGVGAPMRSQRLHWVAAAKRAGLEGHAGNGHHRNEPGRFRATTRGPTAESGATGCVVQANGSGPFARKQTSATTRHGNSTEPASSAGSVGQTESERWSGRSHGENEGRRQCASGHPSPWSDYDICHFTGPDADKARRIEPGTFPLAHGVPARVGRLRGYGNAIVPQVAAEFIAAYKDCCVTL